MPQNPTKDTLRVLKHYKITDFIFIPKRFAFCSKLTGEPKNAFTLWCTFGWNNIDLILLEYVNLVVCTKKMQQFINTYA